jgi:hypothetical protein
MPIPVFDVMSTSAINGLSGSYLQQILASALQSSGVYGNSGNTSGVASTSQSDSAQLSPFAQLVIALQQLQQSDPTKYAQVTQQIATNLQNAAQTAQAQGNSSAANQLDQLATDFTNASQTGQLPDLQDLAQAVGGGHHRRHRTESSTSGSSTASSGSDSSASTANTAESTGTTGSDSTASQALSQLLSSLFQTETSQNAQSSSLNAGAIILSTLSDAGINVSNS